MLLVSGLHLQRCCLNIAVPRYVKIHWAELEFDDPQSAAMFCSVPFREASRSSNGQRGVVFSTLAAQALGAPSKHKSRYPPGGNLDIHEGLCAAVAEARFSPSKARLQRWQQESNSLRCQAMHFCAGGRPLKIEQLGQQRPVAFYIR